jgi:bacterioferritin-associated ferredoxin
MIVCHCHVVTDREIRRAVRGGAHSPRRVARACSAGATCGGCVPAIEGIIREERRVEREPVAPAAEGSCSAPPLSSAARCQ